MFQWLKDDVALLHLTLTLVISVHDLNCWHWFNKLLGISCRVDWLRATPLNISFALNQIHIDVDVQFGPSLFRLAIPSYFTMGVVVGVAWVAVA